MIITLGGVSVALLSRQDLIDRLVQRWGAADGPPLAIASANLDHLYHFGCNGSLYGRLSESNVDWLTTLDGMPLVRAARKRSPEPVDHLAGSDLLPDVLTAAQGAGARVGFLGGTIETHERLAVVLRAAWPDLAVAGMWSPDRQVIEDEGASLRLASEIADAAVDVLVVGLGKPRQELWMQRFLPATNAGTGLAFGAAADFLAGTSTRAPTTFRRYGLEWLYRLFNEPRRLWKRYLLQGPVAAWRLYRCSEPNQAT